MRKLRYLFGWPAMTLLAALTISGPTSVAAAELVVYDAKDCVISKRFHREVAGDYGVSKGSRVFPMRQVDINEGDAGIVLEQAVTLTPTFVFVDEGREIARVTGYPGRELFLRIVDEAADAFLQSKPAL